MGDRNPAERGFSRRKLLAGGVVATPTLALLHETIPHQRLHQALGGNQHPEAAAAAASHGGGTHGGEGTAHAMFAPGDQVDHRANGFNPTEILRDFD
jgi:hypothetical protein